MKFGVQTFTIRKAQKKNIRSSYLPLINLGIKSFEVARIDFNRKNAIEIKSLVDEFGIEIMNFFCELNEKHGKTIVLVTHEPDIAEYCKRVVRFKDGNIISDEVNQK